jgi:acetyl/propionyl-CoA carboxylase alpha subunit
MFQKILIANRAEVALRVVRALRDLGVAGVAVYAQDDAGAPHVALADEAVALDATGPSAYLAIAKLIEIAKRTGCDAIHPGYGFLSERADFALACAEAGIAFIGPTADHLGLFGDKARALALAAECSVPVLPASTGPVTLEQARDFFAAHADAGLMIKAVGGGGGRGMRAVTDRAYLAEAYAR